MKQRDFKPGQKWRVIREGARLSGMKPCGYGAQCGWGMSVPVGTVLTVQGTLMTFGDGVPVVKWLDGNGNWIANDCEFHPSDGGMWSSAPRDGYLAPASPEADAWSCANGAIDHRSAFETSVKSAWCDEACQTDVEGLLARADALEGAWLVWDPEDDDQGFLLAGDDPFELLKQACAHFELEVL